MLTEDTTVFDILQMLPSEAREELTKELQKEMKDMPDMILEQAAMSYAKGVYKDLGIDVEGLQYHYLFATGGKNDRIGTSWNGSKYSGLLSGSQSGCQSGTRYQRKCVPKGGRIFQQ